MIDRISKQRLLCSKLAIYHKARANPVLSLIPKEYRFEDDEKSYEAIMSITKYIAGMTDAFAVDTYRTLQGIQLPNY